MGAKPVCGSLTLRRWAGLSVKMPPRRRRELQLRDACRLESARPRMLHVFELGWNDDAVVVAAIARPDTDQLVRLDIDEGNAAGETLEAAEHAHHVFAVIGDGQGLHIRPDALNFLFDLPRIGIDDHDAAAG